LVYVDILSIDIEGLQLFICMMAFSRFNHYYHLELIRNKKERKNNQ